MENTNVTGLLPSIAKKITPLITDIIAGHEKNLHSIHLVGSAVMPDYNEKLSDINSVVVLHEMDLGFIEFLAPLGKTHAKNRVSAPLVMTPGYIGKSLDSFPMEFLDFKLIHKTVVGEDVLAAVTIEKAALRIQCEREIKTKLIGLRQGYLSSLGKKGSLTEVLVRSITGSMTFFRSILYLLDKNPPIIRADVADMFVSETRIDSDIFRQLLALKAKTIKPSEQELKDLFKRYYHALVSVERLIDDLPC